MHSNENYLIHYGVLGMKWGVRKDRTGQTYYRVGKQKIDINDSGALYVSQTKNDTARYIKYLGPSILAKLCGNAHTHVQALSSSSKLKQASEKQLVEGTLKFLKKDKEALNTLNASFQRAAFFPDKKITKEMIDKALKNQNPRDAKQLAYVFSSILGDSAFSKEASRMYDYFRKEGYDAIPDYFDRNNGTSKTATIIIRPDKVTLASSIKIDKNVYKKSKKHVKKLGKIPMSEVAKSLL